jgi:Flp pilus assembly protein TadG
MHECANQLGNVVLCRVEITKRRPFHGCRLRYGIAATEFALALPILMLVALACADFGRISYYHQAVANAARTGAESGATHGFTDFTKSAWESSVQQSVLNEMQNLPNFDPAELNSQVSTTMDADGLARIVVDVTYPFRTVVEWPLLPSEVMLNQRVAYRQFR